MFGAVVQAGHCRFCDQSTIENASAQPSTPAWLLSCSQKMQYAVQSDDIWRDLIQSIEKKEMQRARAAAEWAVRLHLSWLVPSHDNVAAQESSSLVRSSTKNLSHRAHFCQRQAARWPSHVSCFHLRLNRWQRARVRRVRTLRMTEAAGAVPCTSTGIRDDVKDDVVRMRRIA